MRRHAPVVLGLVVCSVVVAQARAEVLLNPRAFGARISNEALRAATEAAPALIPDVIRLPDVSNVTIYDCPLDAVLDDVVMDMYDGSVNIDDLHELRVEFRDHRLEVGFGIDISGSATVDMQLCGLPDAGSCDIAIASRDIRLNAVFDVFAQNGLPHVEVVEFQVDVSEDPHITTVDVGGCWLGTIAENAESALQSYIVTTLEDMIGTRVQEMVPALVDDLISASLPLDGTLGTFGYRAAIDDLYISDDSLVAWVDAGVEPLATICAPDEAPPPEPEARAEPTLDFDSPAALTFAISHSFVHQAIFAAWKSGLLCVSSAQFGEVELPGAVPGVAQGSLISYRTEIPQEPRLEFGDGKVTLDLPDLRVFIELVSPGADPTRIGMKMSATAELHILLDETGTLRVAIDSMTPGPLTVLDSGGTSVIKFDACSLGVMMEKMILPRFGLDTGSLPVLTARRAFPGVVMTLDTVEIAPPYLNLYLGLHALPDDDRDAPETIVGAAPDGPVRPGKIEITLVSDDGDAGTPRSLIKHVWREAGGEFSEVVDSRALRLDTIVAVGPHDLQIAAVDLAGNRDPTPAVVHVEIDGYAPTITMLERPGGLIDSHRAVVAFTVADLGADAATVQFDWKLLRLNGTCPDGSVTLKEGHGFGGARVDLTDLPEDSHLLFDVVARDAAGNETHATAGFAVNAKHRDMWGCAAGGGGGLWGLLVILGVAVLRRRRRSNVDVGVIVIALALVIALAPRPAFAAALGNWMSGPSTADGAALYWNPSALGALPGKLTTYTSLGLAMISVDYQRAGLDPYDPAGGRYQSVGFFSMRPDPVALVGGRPSDGPVFLGAGIYMPFTGGASYDNERGPQRYFVQKGRNFGIYMGPTAAAEVVSNLYFGASFNAVYVKLESKQSTDLGGLVNGLLPPGAAVAPYEHPLLEGPTTVDADGWGYGFTAGLYWTPLDGRLAIGVAYISAVTADVNGTIDVATSETFRRTFPGVHLQPSGKLHTDFDLPRAVDVGVSGYPTDALELGLDFQWQQTSKQSRLVVQVYDANLDLLNGDQLGEKGLVDDVQLTLKGAYAVRNDMRVGGRVEWDPATVPDETMNPVNLSFDRLELAAGVEWAVRGDMVLTLDYGHSFLGTREIDNSLFVPYAPADSGLAKPSADGRYTASAEKVTVTYTWSWE